VSLSLSFTNLEGYLTQSVLIVHYLCSNLIVFNLCFGRKCLTRKLCGSTQVLNLIVADLFQGHPMSERKLKELLGHTPSQVFAGALLGFLVACFCCQASVVGV